MKLRCFLVSVFCVFTISLLTACDGKNNETGTEKSPQDDTSTSISSEPAIGTMISDITGIGSSDRDKNGNYRELDWKELAPDTDSEKKLVAKYQPLIDKIPEGGKGAKPIYDKMLAEFNALPANPKLDGQKIKIPGYVTVLEQNKGLIKEFLLVPYYGACIHVPPPPLNNTLLIKPKKNQRLYLDDVYSPVWVKGIIHTKNTKTDLATAGYLIENAEVILFDAEEE